MKENTQIPILISFWNSLEFPFHLISIFTVYQLIWWIPGIPNPAAFIPFFASFSLPLGAAVATFMAIVAVRCDDEDDHHLDDDDQHDYEDDHHDDVDDDHYD